MVFCELYTLHIDSNVLQIHFSLEQIKQDKTMLITQHYKQSKRKLNGWTNVMHLYTHAINLFIIKSSFAQCIPFIIESDRAK